MISRISGAGHEEEGLDGVFFDCRLLAGRAHSRKRLRGRGGGGSKVGCVEGWRVSLCGFGVPRAAGEDVHWRAEGGEFLGVGWLGVGATGVFAPERLIGAVWLVMLCRVCWIVRFLVGMAVF